MARYEAGETLSSIARTYDCSPPAISYIVGRSRGKLAGDASPQPVTEPQLVKSHSNDVAANTSVPAEPKVEAPPPVAAGRHKTVAETRLTTLPDAASVNASAGTGSPVGGEQPRKLHLSLGNGHSAGNVTHMSGNGQVPNGNGHPHEPSSRPSFVAPRSSQPQGAGEHNSARPFQAPPRAPAAFDAARNGRDLFAMPESRPAAQQPRDTNAVRKDSSAFIDHELRSRVDGDIAAFLSAFDAALAEDTQESRFGLREATDRLLRAGARTRIELERLEARVPLPPRDARADPDPGAWRHR
jgi:hypothetical protein